MNLRIDPADKDGIHLVDVENGCEQVYIPYKQIPSLISELDSIYKKFHGVEVRGYGVE